MRAGFLIELYRCHSEPEVAADLSAVALAKVEGEEYLYLVTFKILCTDRYRVFDISYYAKTSCFLLVFCSTSFLA